MRGSEDVCSCSLFPRCPMLFRGTTTITTNNENNDDAIHQRL